MLSFIPCFESKALEQTIGRKLLAVSQHDMQWRDLNVTEEERVSQSLEQKCSSVPEKCDLEMEEGG